MNLESWRKVVTHGGMFSSPADATTMVVTGIVYGHPELADGTEATFNLIGWHYREQAFLSPTGLEFRLRTPHPDYERQFPNSIKALNTTINARKFVIPTEVLARIAA